MRTNRQKKQINLPNHSFTKKGGLNQVNIAKIQRMQTRVGSDTYNRYKDLWHEMEGINQEEKVIEEENRRSFLDVVNEQHDEEFSNYRGIEEEDSETINQIAEIRNQIVEDFREKIQEKSSVWVGIKFDEDEHHYRLREIYGETIEQEVLESLQEDEESYKNFEYLCWSSIIGETIESEDYLYEVLSELLEVPVSRVKGARVDSEYDEGIEDVVLTFKARIISG